MLCQATGCSSLEVDGTTNLCTRPRNSEACAARMLWGALHHHTTDSLVSDDIRLPHLVDAVDIELVAVASLISAGVRCDGCNVSSREVEACESHKAGSIEREREGEP